MGAEIQRPDFECVEDALQNVGLDIPKGLRAEDLCLTRKSSDMASTRYEVHIEASKNADIVVTTHAMAMIDALYWGSVVAGAGDHPIRVGIFDEADRLFDAADSVTGVRIRLIEIENLDPDILAAAQSLLPSNDKAVPIDIEDEAHRALVDAVDSAGNDIADGSRWVDAARADGVLHAVIDVNRRAKLTPFWG